MAIEKDWRQDFETKLAEYVCQQEEHKLQKDLWAQQYKAAHKEGKTAPDRPSDLTAAPVLKRIITNDASYEKLHAVMRENPAGVLLVSDELSGWLGRISRPEHAEERAFALSCWNGKTSPYRGSHRARHHRCSPLLHVGIRSRDPHQT